VSITLIRDQIAASIAVKQAVLADDQLIAQIEKLAADCIQCLQSGGKVIFAGNGGSFSDAQHLSAEFVSRFMFDRAPLASLVLGANNSTISAETLDTIRCSPANCRGWPGRGMCLFPLPLAATVAIL